MAEIRRELQPQHHHSGINLSDILFALFRRKWTYCALHAPWHHRRGGVLFPLSACVRVPGQIAGALCSGKERRRSDRQRPPGRIRRGTDRVIDSEMQILTSWDLAVQVAEAIGPKRFGASASAAAAGSISPG